GGRRTVRRLLRRDHRDTIGALRRQLRGTPVADPHLALQLSRTSARDPREHTRRRPDRRPSRRPNQRKRETLTRIQIRRHSSERQRLPRYPRLLPARQKYRRLTRRHHRHTNGALRRQLRGTVVGDPHFELQLSRIPARDPREPPSRPPDRRPSRRPNQRERETLTRIQIRRHSSERQRLPR